MEGSLTGTVALVTGASSGIGAATARALAANGAAVAAVARRRERLDALVGELTAAGARALAIEADITLPGRAGAAVACAVERYGRLDILINNAGVMLLGPMLGAPADEWDRMLDLNVRGLLAVSREAFPHLIAAASAEPRQVADIVNISSVAGRTVRAGSGVYNMTKWGVGILSEALRQEITSQYVRVAVIEPGVTATELSSHLRPEIAHQLRERFAGITPLSASDVADTIVFVVTRARGVAVNEILLRPTTQVA
jgi:NADP-dependent 3-hydroxy acid dehydrogenase YdfG